jgi:predicted acylesterase/phospholipase RssA
VGECIDEYMDLMRNVFKVDQVLEGVKPAGDDECRFDYGQLERAIKDIVKRKLRDENTTMAATHEASASTPTFVVATKSLHAEGSATLFRSYQCQGRSPSGCAIWEAGRATTASPTLFKPITIEIPRPGATFLDGGLTHNNPAELALSEARRIWTNIKRFCLVSIGTGRLSSIRIGDIQPKNFPSSDRSKVSWWISATTDDIPVSSGSTALTNIAKRCLELAANPEPAHQRLLGLALSADPETKFPYYRFNVEQAMQDINLQEWNKMEEIGAHTDAYMGEGEAESKMNKCVQDLMVPPEIECKYATSNGSSLFSYQAHFSFQIFYGSI